MTDNTLEMVIRARDEATAVINKVAKDVSNMGKNVSSGASQAMTSMNLAGNASKNFASSLVSLPSLIIGTATSFGLLKAVNVAGELETMEKGFVTLLGSADAAGKVMERIRIEAARTPFEVAGLTSATQALALVTKDGDKAIDTLLNVGKALAGAGKGQVELDRIIANLQQIALTGKITAMDIRQFGMNGVNILEMLADYYGTTTEKAAEMVANSKNAFDDLSGAFAKAGSEGGKFFTAYTDQAGTFNQLVSNAKDNVNMFLSDFAKMTGLFDFAKGVLTSFNDTLPKLLKGIKDLTDFIKNNQWVIYSFAGAITGALIPALLASLPALALMLGAFVAGAIALAPWIIGGALIGGIVAGIVWLIQNWDLVQQKASEIWGFVSDYIKQRMDELSKFLESIWTGVSTFFTSIWQGISNFFTNIWNGIYATSQYILALLVGFIITIFENLGIDIVGIIETLKVVVPMAWQWISDRSTEIWNGIRDFFIGIGQRIKEIWNGVMNWLKTFFSTIWESIRSNIMEKINLIVEIFNAISPTISKIWENMWNGMRDIVIGIWDGIVGVVKASINFIIDGINVLIRGLNSIAQKSSRIGLSVPSIPEIPRLAKGGIVNRPTIAMVGEAGPEAIVPLNRRGRQQSFGTGEINVYVSNNNFYGDDREFAQKIGKQIVDELGLQMRLT